MVRISSPPLTHHPHRRPRRWPHLVPAPISRTRCLHSLTVSTLSGTRPRSIESSSPRIWRPSALTCIPSWLTRRPFSEISNPSRPSSPSFSPSTSHRRQRHSDATDHQGSFLHPLLFFYLQWGHWSHVFGGVWVVIGFC